MGFLGPPSEPIKLPSPLIGILSEFSSSWKVPNVDSRLWLLQGHNMNTIIYYTRKSAKKLFNTLYPHKSFIRCNAFCVSYKLCITDIHYSSKDMYQFQNYTQVINDNNQVVSTHLHINSLWESLIFMRGYGILMLIFWLHKTFA